MLTTLLIDALLVVVVALLGNEFRLIIDEKHETRSIGHGHHDAATVPFLIPAGLLVARHERIAEDRALFERVAYDFECAAMSQRPKEIFVVEGSVAE